MSSYKPPHIRSLHNNTPFHLLLHFKMIHLEISSGNVRVILPINVRGQLLMLLLIRNLLNKTNLIMMMRVTSSTLMNHFHFCRCRGRGPYNLFIAILRIINNRLFLCHHNNNSIRTCTGGHRFKAEGCQSTSAMDPWYSGVVCIGQFSQYQNFDLMSYDNTIFSIFDSSGSI